MKILVFGLSVSSSWGNGHATLWRGLIGALARRGHEVCFFERDVPYYAANRDLTELQGGVLVLYPNWEQILPRVKKALRASDVAVVTSYCPDGVAAAELVTGSQVGCRVFYDLDTPITIEQLTSGVMPAYVPENGYRDFDLVLSYTGGSSLRSLSNLLGARKAIPLYGSVDPSVHYRVSANDRFKADLSYMGTYADDRQAALQQLFLSPAQRMTDARFMIAGALYPKDFPWRKNIFHLPHVHPGEHPAFYSSSRITLNVTRSSMSRSGYAPSGRLFEAAACGVPVLSDHWTGLEEFFEPGREILIAADSDDALQALGLPERELARIGDAARKRVLSEHTADHRALVFEKAVKGEAA
ncbi:MAG TPA: glycosyltransferase [Bdellovibrionota bacterium]|nr:glycosyltransferase [Bdellovibrionota bacterium]